jgi:hypothetical protein
MKLKSIFCCSSRFGESNLRPERIRNLLHIRPHDLIHVGIGVV